MRTLSPHPPVRLAAALERRLGDPHDPQCAFSYARFRALDDEERFPADVCAELDDLGVHRYDVPAERGGAMADREQPAALLRVLARRDLAVAVTHTSKSLGAEPVWVGGDAVQASWVAGELLSGARFALGLTEAGHGGDLLATGTTAVPDRGGYRLDGEKWLINGATRGQVVCVLARTEPTGGPAGMSMLLVDKRRIAEGTFECLPKVSSHGLRAADVSGIRFDGARVGADALVGRRGGGLDVVLKALQVSRAGCVALSLGAADQALDVAARFAVTATPGGRRPLDLPAVRRVLGTGYTRLFVAEAVGVVANRGIHALTGELSVISAVAKSFVPTLVDDCIADLAELLGAHAFTADGSAAGRFEKLERDHRIVGIFDGSTFANRSALVNQFERLARSYRQGRTDPAGLTGALRLGGPLDPVDPRRLSIVSRTGCSLVQDLPRAAEEVRCLARAGDVPPVLVGQAEALVATAGRLHDDLGRRWARLDLSPEAFDLAERYELVFSAGACLAVWLRNRHRVPDAAACVPWNDGRWPVACLSLLLRELDADAPAGDEVFDDLFDLVHGAGSESPASILPDLLGGDDDVG